MKPVGAETMIFEKRESVAVTLFVLLVKNGVAVHSHFFFAEGCIPGRHLHYKTIMILFQEDDVCLIHGWGFVTVLTQHELSVSGHAASWTLHRAPVSLVVG